MSPYFGKSFFEFFPIFFHRLFLFCTGALPWSALAPDEVQVLVFSLVSIAATLVGTLLVLRKMTMLANSLSHTILLGIVIAYLFTSSGGGFVLNMKILVLAAFVTGFLTTLMTQLLHEKMQLQEDASIGLVFTSLFALGILLVTLYTRNSHFGIEAVMGNADALHFDDLKIATLVAGADLFFLLLFFKEWRLVCFDPALATNLGFRPTLFHYLLMLLASGTAIMAFRAVGVLLFLAFLVGLPLTARQITHSMSKIFWYGSLLGITASLLGAALSRHFLTAYQMPLSTSGLVTTLIGGFFLLVIFLKKGHTCLDEASRNSRKHRLDRAKCPQDH